MELDAGDSGYVRAVRARLGLSQEQLAQRLGVSFVTVNRWEAGHSRLSRSARQRLAELADGGNALPVPQDALIGRETELENLAKAFERIRLLTLTGPGGIGKTRLAIDLARRVRLPGERVVFVPLDGPGPAGPDARVAAAFGVRDKAGAPAGEALIRILASGPALLVLDGAERATSAGTGDAPLPAYVGRLLASQPATRVLITSRRLTGAPGEHAWPVPPLSDQEAARLFAVRARERSPGFEVNGGTSGAVGELCRRLDRLPLAIELAAAWAGTLSVEQILRLWPDLGGSGGPGTLQSVAESSYALLNPAEQALLAQLSVFAGSFTLDDVRAVVTDLAGPGLVVALRGLVDASWLTASPDGPEQTYSMLSTLRDYAAGLSGADSTVRDRHARHFGELARLSTVSLVGPDQVTWVRRMNRASADFDAALDWAAQTGNADLGLSISASLWRWWRTTGRLAEGRGRLNYFLAAASGSDPLLIAEARHVEAALANDNGEYAHAIAQATRALTVFRDAGAETDPEMAKSAAQAATVLGIAHRYLGEYPTARHYMDLSARYWKINGSRPGITRAMNNQALMLLDAGELDEAERVLTDVLAIFKHEMNDPHSVAVGLHNLGHVHVNAGHAEAARAALAEAGPIAASLGDRHLSGVIASTTGDLYRTQGQHESAIHCYREALDHHRAAGTMRDVVVALRGLGLSLYHLGEVAEASQVLHEGEALALAANDAKRIGQIREALAVLASSGPAPAPGPSAPGPSAPHPSAAAAPSLPELTPRQAEVLALLSTGLTNKDIAEALHLSIGTVERHLATIYRKVGLRNRAEATRYAIQLGL